MKASIILSFFSALPFFVCACNVDNKIELVRHEDRIDIVTDNRLIATYLFGHHLSKPILYPIKSPSGEVVTRWYPFEIVEGESNDHPHHTGLFFTYGGRGEVNGSSFWANPHDRPPLTMDAKLPRSASVG